MDKEKVLHLMLVDDDATDRELFMEALQLSGKKATVTEAAHGDDALARLQQAPPPDLIILDLNMPVKDGRQTLLELKAHPQLRCIPVCIMSTSSAHFDVQTAYAGGANLFLEKPHDFNQLIDLLRSLLELFQKHVSLARINN